MTVMSAGATVGTSIAETVPMAAEATAVVAPVEAVTVSVVIATVAAAAAAPTGSDLHDLRDNSCVGSGGGGYVGAV